MRKILLIAMPDTVRALDAVMQVPNLGLCSIAGNLEGGEVKVIDLAFHNQKIGDYLRTVIKEFAPEVVGLSAMSHQYASACRVAEICRRAKSDIMVVLGGYHASLMYQEIGSGRDGELFDFIVRGEGEKTFQNLIRILDSGLNDFKNIPGLSFRENGRFHHNTSASLLDLNTVMLPDRNCRWLDNAQFMGQSFDCVETSRGCTMGCRFCSIKAMYGRQMRLFPLERVIADLKQVKEKGKKGVFFVDDNITLNVPRLIELCQLIVSEKLNDLSYAIQASVSGIVADPELAVRLRNAGFKWVFLGIESGISRNLDSMGKEGVLHNVQRAVSWLRREGIGVFGGFIIGHPGDTRKDILSTYEFALKLKVDHPIVQCLTPYPKTEIREELAARSLITNMEDFSLYNGFTCNVRTESLDSRQLNHAIFWGGLGLYFHPKYLFRSRFWRIRLSLIPALIANNIRYLYGALRGKIFVSGHKW